MTKQRAELISELVADTKHTRKCHSVWMSTLLWVVISFGLTFFIMVMTGPFREDDLKHLLEHPQFGLEIILGVLTVIALAAAGFRSGIPSPNNRLRGEFLWPLIILFGWLMVQVYAVYQPALVPSMQGKRHLCLMEVLVYGLPGLIFGYFLINRFWPLKPGWSGLLLGLSAGVIPAVLMQMACMYEPVHNLTYHTLPALILGLVGSLMGWLFIKKNS